MEEISKRDVEVIEAETTVLIEQAKSYIIENAQDVDSASNFLRRVKDLEDAIEAKRLTFTKPINQSLKAINETFKELSKPLAGARQIVAVKILDWRRAENERIAEEEKKIQASYEKMGSKIEIPIVLERPETKIGNVQVRKTWSWETINFSELEDKFKEENTVEINRAIRDGVRDIKGLRIYQKEGLSIV